MKRQPLASRERRLTLKNWPYKDRQCYRKTPRKGRHLFYAVRPIADTKIDAIILVFIAHYAVESAITRQIHRLALVCF